MKQCKNRMDSLKKIVFSAVLFSTLLFFSGAGICQTIKIVGDVFEPYNSDPQNDKLGYVVDIAKAIYENEGYSVEYDLRPWRRALNETKSGKFHMLAGAAEDVAGEYDLKMSKASVGVTGYEIVVRKNDPWEYKGINSLKGRKLGIIKDYSMPDELKKYVEENRDDVYAYPGTGEAALKSNLLKLIKGRIDLTFDDKYVLRYVANSLGILDQLKPAGTLGVPYHLYMVFTPNNSNTDKYIKIFDDGIKKLRVSGELKEILARYGLEDWEK